MLRFWLRAAALSALLITLAAGHAHAADRPTPQSLIGRVTFHQAVAEDTFADLAVTYELGFTELVAANPGIDPWLPPAGATITLPTAHLLPDAPRNGIVVNLADQRLYLFRPRAEPLSFPIGIGADGIELVTGLARVVRKRVRPSWTPPQSIRDEVPDLPATVPPGPDNPLGAFALDLDWPRIVIHGTNRPYGVGRRVSHGCIRLYDAHIAILHRLVLIGTPVRFVNQPVKVGWSDNTLMLEIHPTVSQAATLEETPLVADESLPDLLAVIGKVAGAPLPEIDWFAVRFADTMRTGIPVPIARRAASGQSQEPPALR